MLRALGLGDLLTGAPALRGLRRLHPGRPLVLAAPAGIGGWLQSLGVVDAVIPTNGLDGAPPGTGLGAHDAVDLHGNGWPSHDLLLAAEPRSLLALALPEAAVIEAYGGRGVLVPYVEGHSTTRIVAGRAAP